MKDMLSIRTKGVIFNASKFVVALWLPGWLTPWIRT